VRRLLADIAHAVATGKLSPSYATVAIRALEAALIGVADQAPPKPVHRVRFAPWLQKMYEDPPPQEGSQ
jgi:hypothetical protein